MTIAPYITFCFSNICSVTVEKNQVMFVTRNGREYKLWANYVMVGDKLAGVPVTEIRTHTELGD